MGGVKVSLSRQTLQHAQRQEARVLAGTVVVHVAAKRRIGPLSNIRERRRLAHRHVSAARQLVLSATDLGEDAPHRSDVKRLRVVGRTHYSDLNEQEKRDASLLRTKGGSVSERGE